MKGKWNGRNETADVSYGAKKQGADKSKIYLFFLAYFLVAMPTRLVQNTAKGEESKGLINLYSVFTQ